MRPDRNNRRSLNIDSLAESLLSDLEGKRLRDGWRSICPFHEGADNPTSFHITDNGSWRCYSCGASGTTLEELVSRRTGIPLAMAREAVDNLPGRFRHIGDVLAVLNAPPAGSYAVLPDSAISEFMGGCPAYLVYRGFDRKVLHDYEIGYDYSDEKIVLPCRDIHGDLVGLTRRQDGHTEHLWPKYKHESFTKTQHLYGGHLAREWKGDLYVVEGQLDAVRVTQLGARGVAMMGAYISPEQVDLLSSLPASRIILALDNDQAGKVGTAFAIKRLRKVPSVLHRLHIADYSTKDPGDLLSLEQVTARSWLQSYVIDPLYRVTSPSMCAIIEHGPRAGHRDRKPVRR